MSEYKKKCSCCKQEKIAEHCFDKNDKYRDGFQSRCKACSRAKSLENWRKKNPGSRKQGDGWSKFKNRQDHHYQYKYNITEDDVKAMIVAQGGRCAICEDPLLIPFVDHCHKTGVVRGIVCPRCNNGLGSFKDSVELVEKALVYLLQSGGTK